MIDVELATNTRYKKDGVSATYIRDKQDQAYLVPGDSYDKERGVFSGPDEAVIPLGKDSLILHDLLVQDGKFDASYEEIFDTFEDGYSGRNVLLHALDTIEELKGEGYTEAFDPLQVDGKPFTEENVKEAYGNCFSYDEEQHLEALDDYFCTHNPEERHDKLTHDIEELLDTMKDEYEHGGDMSPTTYLKNASHSLVFPHFNYEGDYFEKELAVHAAEWEHSGTYLDDSVRQTIRDVVFHTSNSRLPAHQKEQANQIFQALKKADTKGRAEIITDLACGGEKRKQRLKSFEKAHAVTR